MNVARLSLLSWIGLLLLAQLASAAGGGGGGGGNFGGGRGADLNEEFKQGTELLTSGDCKKAERKFRKVLKVVAKNPEANYFRGLALSCQDKHKAATRWFKKAVRYDAKLYPAYEKLGRSYLALGEQGDAEEQLTKLRALMKKCGDACPKTLRAAHSALAAALLAGEEPGEAESSDPHGLLFDPVADPEAFYLGAVELIHSEEFEAAIEALRQLTLQVGPHADLLNYLGYAHRRLERFEEAETYYEQALVIDPLHRGANEYLGEMFVELGRLDEARHRLAILDQACPFGCAEYEDLERMIEKRLVAAQ